jgi:lipopolysaccharide export LptBFGC system permease protein LptF
VVTMRGAVERTSVKYAPFVEKDLPLEPPSYFKTENIEPEWMTYGQLKRYVTQLRASGFNAVPDMVALQRKVSFPLVTVVMTLLAVPFAVTAGRRGALYGIGVGIVLAIVYWTTLSVFAAMGAGGLISPVLAAWSPNILFGAAAVYMVLTVRT